MNTNSPEPGRRRSSAATPLPFAMTAADAAAHLGVSEAALAQMRWRGDGPDYIKHGRAVRYLPAAIQAWWESNTVAARPVPMQGRRP